MSSWRSLSMRAILGGAPNAPPLQLEFGLSVLDQRRLALGGDGIDDDAAALSRFDRASDNDLLLGDAHPTHLHREALQRPRVAVGEGRVGFRHQPHRVEAVEDVPRQPDGFRELVVDVDRVEVTRGAGVAVRQVLVRGDPQLRDLVACVQSHLHTPLTISVQVPRATWPPSWLTLLVSNT